ncbi:MAG: hypothetical protein CVV18_08540 [Gammaproteobacteria bacterium HGW-Gammaproteobacteria-8]|nr:MAG: hypothetical protein CVV18_08540 [Gammaproteobacteria bacterium HGW-Gammaproteobacteria-8]
MNRSQLVLGLAAGIGLPATALAGAFIFADGPNPERIAHPTGYFGTGGDLQVRVCIDPSSDAINEMQVSVQNSIALWNQRQAVSPNVFLGGNNNIPSGQVDFESTLTHEMGHCLGLAHPNEATESGLPAADRDYTKTDPGPNGVRDLNPGSDGIKGSADDIRGDDINLHWFNIGINNPFVATPPFDASNYSRNLADLPPGDSFAANADRTVGGSLGFPNSEAVMQQGAFTDEDQRQLAIDDVTTLGLGMSGLDRTSGTADDYRPVLVFDGVQAGCDININVTGTSFAFCSVSGAIINGNNNHLRLTQANVQLGSTSNFSWFFNQEPVVVQEEIFSDGFES